MGQLIGARLRLGAWAASTSSVIALLASGVSLWETVLKQPSLKVHIGETFSYTRDPWGSYEVFAVPVTIMNSGARDGAVMSLRLDLTNTDTGQKETFESAYTADSGWFSGADNVTTRTRRPKMQFSPLSINGRSAWSGTILFYSPEAREKKLAEPKSQVTGVLSINASMPDGWLERALATTINDKITMSFAVPTYLPGALLTGDVLRLRVALGSSPAKP